MDAWLAEWVDKAEHDFDTMGREAVVTERPNYDDVCFHAQQCVEKYLKARFYDAAAKNPPREHNLGLLLNRVLPHEPTWEAHRADLVLLNRFATRIRYPGHGATEADAAEAVEACRRFRRAARDALGLSG